MEETEEKKTDSPNWVMRKKIGKVLNFMYLVQKRVKIDEILRGTGLKKKQIYRALQFLKNVNAVTKEYDIQPGFGKNKPPIKTLFVRLNEYQKRNAERYLRRKRKDKRYLRR